MENLPTIKKNTLEEKLLLILFFNLILFILEFIGTYLSIKAFREFSFIYYTNLSNYFALISSLIVCIEAIICLRKKTPIPSFFYSLKFSVNVCLSITFLVCFCLLIPLKPDIFEFMVSKDANFLFHIICPILSIAVFFVIEKSESINKRIIFISSLPTMFYGIILSILNLTKLVIGPYPFFIYRSYPLTFCIPCVFGIYFLSLLISLIFYVIKRFQINKTTKKA